jgi:hypothetical protein
MVLSFSSQHPQPKAALNAPTASKSKSNSIAQMDGASDTSNRLTKLDSKEEREVGDKSTPLISAQTRKQQSVPTASGGGGGGLWGAKAAPKSNNGLWGPPKLDDVYEHSHGPKRRWTVTEREEP